MMRFIDPPPYHEVKTFCLLVNRIFTLCVRPPLYVCPLLVYIPFTRNFLCAYIPSVCISALCISTALPFIPPSVCMFFSVYNIMPFHVYFPPCVSHLYAYLSPYVSLLHVHLSSYISLLYVNLSVWVSPFHQSLLISTYSFFYV